MKKLSVKMKVTLWYASFMILMVIFILGFLFFIGEYVVSSGSQDRIIRIVENSYDEIEYDEGKLEIDDDLEFSSSGMYLSIFDKQGDLQYGHVPNVFTTNFDFKDGVMQTHKKNGNTWYIYDSQFNISGYGNIWVRGVMSLDESANAFSTMLKLAMFAMPFLVLIAIFMGYLITKRAFRPITQIQEAAQRIGEDKDLSKRINLGKGTDEIYTLANTFDSMFERLETAFENERQFTSDASHELRTPTTVIISQCEYALETANTLDEAKSALESILDQSRKMSFLINQLLTLARADKNHSKIHLELINLSELCEVIAMQQQELAKEKDIEIKTDLESDVLIHGDETMLMRLFLNLIENGIRYGRHGGHLMISLNKDNEQVIVRIKDDGIGIHKEHLNKIWERFYQVDSARSSSKEGLGLGLSMVKWIVEAHLGQIEVESMPDVGTTFIITLPLK